MHTYLQSITFPNTAPFAVEVLQRGDTVVAKQGARIWFRGFLPGCWTDEAGYEEAMEVQLEKGGPMPLTTA